METMDTVVAVAIGILATIFVASLVALVFVCRQKYCQKFDLISAANQREVRPDVQLINSMETGNSEQTADVELSDVQVTNPNLEEILKDERWVDDATGLVPHCIAILKTCHQLTERLVGMTMENSQQIRTQETLTDIISISKRVSPRVDEVVKCMYPPLDARLLEARCSALVLLVSHLVLITKHACHLSGGLDWIDQSLADVEDHLVVLREASVNEARALASTAAASGEGDLPNICNGGVNSPTNNNNNNSNLPQQRIESSSQV
ncbi:transmembrane protein 98-like [Liolophura sinensis]|uniref:transmembrane protein 98-like n=1 Tax=Liolophura sinensis TaxID=3198878 RepID=UPI0031596E5C